MSPMFKQKVGMTKFIKTSRENPRLQSWDERRQVK